MDKQLATKQQLDDADKIDEIISQANLIRDESRIEIGYWNDRKQEFQSFWMGCVGASALALAATSPFVFIGVPLVLGVLNWKLAESRRPGLQRSLAEVDNRHKMFLEFIEQHPCLKKLLGFSRVMQIVTGDGKTKLIDPAHDELMKEFRSIFTLADSTPYVAIAIAVLGGLKFAALLHTLSLWNVLTR